MKTHQTSILIAALAALALLASPLSAIAATETIYTFSENFDGLTVDSTLHNQNGWTVADSASARAIIRSGSFKQTNGGGFTNPTPGGQVLDFLGGGYAYRGISLPADSETLSVTLKIRNSDKASNGGNANFNAGVLLRSGANAWTGSTISVMIANNSGTGWANKLQYSTYNTETQTTTTTTVTVDRTDENSFVPGPDTWYSIALDVNLAAHTYSFTITDENANSIVWTSPAALGIDPAFKPNWLVLSSSSNASTDNGGVFDDLALTALKTVADPAIPEPATTSLLVGALVLAGMILSRRIR
ncbi:MAG: PEP-CTERM sorting domain-containing protein [Opitutaceae bacterium]|jgi:hypothetical protein|nr:PEP-CTERM sorting domain-containing protein [Opitutaceae bacterium]